VKANTYVRIEKLDGLPSELFKTALMSDWVAGQDNPGKGLPAGYTVEGYLLTDVKVGHPIKMDRRKRNNIDTIGDFQTSDIMEFKGELFTTRNSIYRILTIEEPCEQSSNENA